MASNPHNLHETFSELVTDVPTVRLHSARTPTQPQSPATVVDEFDAGAGAAPDDDGDDGYDDATDAEGARLTPLLGAKRRATRAPDGDDDESAGRTSSQAKKEHHNTHTRRCRARLNWRFDALYDMLPKPAGSDVKHKVQILDHAIATFHGLHQENAELELTVALRSRAHTCSWIDSFAPGALNVVAALVPLLNLFCHRKNWLYAEIWSLKNGPDQSDSQTMSVDHFVVKSSTLLKSSPTELGDYMRQLTCQTYEDFVGRSFEQCQPQWSTSCIAACRDPTRTRLLHALRMRTCLAVPVAVNGSVTHAVAFYDIHERAYDQPLIDFAMFAATTIGNRYGAAQQKLQFETSGAVHTPRGTPRATPKTSRLKA